MKSMINAREALPRELDRDELRAVRRLCTAALEFVRVDVAQRLAALGLVRVGESTLREGRSDYVMVIRKFLPQLSDWADE